MASGRSLESPDGCQGDLAQTAVGRHSHGVQSTRAEIPPHSRKGSQMAASTKTTSKRSSSAKSTKSTGRKSAAAKSTKSTGKKAGAAKRQPSASPVKSSAKPGTSVVRRFEQHQDAAHAATALMRHGGRNEGRAPVATSNIADVMTALSGRKPETLLSVTTAQLVKLAKGEKVPEKIAQSATSAAREFSSDAFGRASTKNKIRGAKLLAILAVVAQPVKSSAPAKSAAKSSARKSVTKSTTKSGRKSSRKGSR